MCLQKGQAKATYGTGCFVLYNTGDIRVNSIRGLLTTVAYQLGSNNPPFYALEGSVSLILNMLFSVTLLFTSYKAKLISACGPSILHNHFFCETS